MHRADPNQRTDRCMEAAVAYSQRASQHASVDGPRIPPEVPSACSRSFHLFRDLAPLRRQGPGKCGDAESGARASPHENLLREDTKNIVASVPNTNTQWKATVLRNHARRFIRLRLLLGFRTHQSSTQVSETIQLSVAVPCNH